MPKQSLATTKICSNFVARRFGGVEGAGGGSGEGICRKQDTHFYPYPSPVGWKTSSLARSLTAALFTTATGTLAGPTSPCTKHERLQRGEDTRARKAG